MFYGPLSQSTELEETIELPDISPTAFRLMLQFAYADDTDFEIENGCPSTADLLNLLYCSKKYLISKLTRECRDRIQSFIDPENACLIFQQARCLEEEILAKIALAEISRYAADAMDSAGFYSLSLPCVKEILDQPDLFVIESYIYEFVRAWVNHNVAAAADNLREAFGPLLYSIRFPVFSADELFKGPVKDGVLTDREVRDIFQHIHATEKPILPFLTMFRTSPRNRCIWEFTFTNTVLKRTPWSCFSVRITMYPNFAPECCRFLRQIIEGQCRILFEGYTNRFLRCEVPGTAIMEEATVLSHSEMGACWLEWDVDEVGAISGLRIAAWRKPAANHSAVFGKLEDTDSDFQEMFRNFSFLPRTSTSITHIRIFEEAK
ncbi:BTB/POZ domain-containing protein 3-like [Paramacrobiotus metropolitanus]|uniref:BTB/POZ domain-containing protein 3-like n=1 Tax=Paramacrobiotus metropolitanus TaxID=2943436 RepID=UPI0024460B4E|nr:BTB/POZ domain-containing protein 3-like [Paramacrobiotus metropolitanus]